MMPDNVERLAESRDTAPGGQLLWTFLVTDQLVQAAGEDWSQPMRFRFEKRDDGRLEMWVQMVADA